jgi:hypothetical protein
MTGMGKSTAWRLFYKALDARVLMYGAAAKAAAMFARDY